MTNTDENRLSEWLTDLAALPNADEAEIRRILSARLSAAEEIEKAFGEIVIARRIQTLMSGLRDAEIETGADFEARLMSRIAEDQTLLNLLEVYLDGFAEALVEIINALLAFLPEPQPNKRATA